MTRQNDENEDSILIRFHYTYCPDIKKLVTHAKVGILLATLWKYVLPGNEQETENKYIQKITYMYKVFLFK